jgi:uncharacterized protein YndB with AHSA1/START domain
MRRVEIQDEIVADASPEEVWRAIDDPVRHARWHPFVTSIDGAHALGSTRRCQVLLGKKAAETEELCTTYEQGKTILWRIDKDSSGFLRMVSDWTAGFVLEPDGPGRTRVTAQSIFKPRNPLIGLMMPMVRRKFHQVQQAVLDGLKQFVERERG